MIAANERASARQRQRVHTPCSRQPRGGRVGPGSPHRAVGVGVHRPGRFRPIVLAQSEGAPTKGTLVEVVGYSRSSARTVLTPGILPSARMPAVSTVAAMAFITRRTRKISVALNGGPARTPAIRCCSVATTSICTRPASAAAAIVCASSAAAYASAAGCCCNPDQHGHAGRRRGRGGGGRGRGRGGRLGVERDRGWSPRQQRQRPRESTEAETAGTCAQSSLPPMGISPTRSSPTTQNRQIWPEQ